MSKNTIELVIRGSVNGVTEAVSSATGALGDLGRSAATALGTLAGNLATAAIQKVGELARAIGDTLFNEAPALDQISRSFENLAATAGTSGAEVLASMREASRGMVSDADLMTSYNEAMLLVGESMATKFPALLEIAQASAAATGQDVGFMLDSLVKGIGRGSPMILDNLGLTINLAEANQKYADSLGISVDQMTKAQQQEALLNATIDAGGDFIARLGDNTSESAVSVAQMKATLENLKNGIAAGLLPVISALLSPILQLAQDHGPQLIAWAEQAGLWLGENLPRAIEGLQALFSGDITSAISNVGAILGSTFGPETMGTFMTFSNEIKGAWNEVWGFLQEIFGSFVSWFQENLPLIQETGQTLVDFWQNHVAPTLDNVWAIIKEVVRIGVEFIQTILTTVMQVINGDWAGAWETIKTGAVEIWESLKTIATEFIEGVLNAIGSSTEEFVAVWSNNWEMLKTIVTTVWEQIKAEVSGKVAEFIAVWRGNWEMFRAIVATLWEQIRADISEKVQAVELVLQTFAAFITAIWEGIKNAVIIIVGTLLAFITGDTESGTAMVQAIWERLKGFVIEQIWNPLSSAAQAIWEAISTEIKTRVEALSEALPLLWEEIQLRVKQTWETIQFVAKETWEAISTEIKTRVEDLKEALPRIWEEIKSGVQQTWEDLVGTARDKVSEFDSVVRETFKNVRDFISTFSLVDVGKNLIRGLTQGVKDVAGELIDSVRGAVQNAIDAAKALLGISSPSAVFGAMGENVMLSFADSVKNAATAPLAAVNMALGGLTVNPVVESLSRDGGGKNTTINVYPQQSTGSVFRDLLLVEAML